MFDELDTNTQQYEQTQPQEQETQPVQQQNSTQESQKEANMRILRERAEAAERRALELERMVQMNMSQNNQQAPQKLQLTEEEDDFDLSDDTYIEGKHLKKYVKSLKQELKNTKKQFEEFHQQNSLAQAEVKLKSQFSDFDSVVSAENLEKLKLQKPSLFRSIMSNPDIYDRGYTAYELIKNSGMVNESYQQVDKRLEENKAKPRSAANASPQTGETPLARVGDYDRRILSEERKEQLRRQVEEAKRYKS